MNYTNEVQLTQVLFLRTVLRYVLLLYTSPPLSLFDPFNQQIEIIFFLSWAVNCDVLPLTYSPGRGVV